MRNRKVKTCTSTPSGEGSLRSRPCGVDLLFPRQEVSADQDAIVLPVRCGRNQYRYERTSFRQLQHDVLRLAAGLQAAGVRQGMKIVVLVPFGPDFITLVFAMLQTGAQMVLIDPGMGTGKLLQCLAEVEPEGFVGTAKAHFVRWCRQGLFPRSRIHVVVGNGWPGTNLRDLRCTPVANYRPPQVHSGDPAAIIFTTGSTGPAKGVQFTRANLIAQITQIQQTYGIPPGGVDLACFPLFGLFNAAMGVTTVIADLDPRRPAAADPRRIVRLIQDLKVEQSFASPAVWNRVGRFCAAVGIKLPSLRRVFSAGAPVATHVLRRLQEVVDRDCQIATPYGATEALPVATIMAAEVLAETAAHTAQGGGICVGRRFDQLRWRIIAVSDDALLDMDRTVEMPIGKMGELVVAGPQVTQRYVTGHNANSLHKIEDGNTIWHRMGDVGYVDDQQRFWYCGRKSHRVQTALGPMYTICCEAVFNEHPRIYRSALVGLGEAGQQLPIVICEPWPGQWPRRSRDRERLRSELAKLARQNPRTQTIGLEQIYLKRHLPVDIRHNAKISREKLLPWVLARTSVETLGR